MKIITFFLIFFNIVLFSSDQTMLTSAQTMPLDINTEIAIQAIYNWQSIGRFRAMHTVADALTSDPTSLPIIEMEIKKMDGLIENSYSLVTFLASVDNIF